jgi:heme/copper-type cytochrome/quinol oxidase subunit 3
MFGVFAALYYWYPKMSGRLLSEKWGKLHFWLTVIGFNMTFFVQHFLGLLGMPRRVYTYPDLPYWTLWNMISTVGAFIMGISVLVLLWNMIVTSKSGKLAGDNPWNAWTLEWATTSPPPHDNFHRLPPIRGRRPLWDWGHPNNPDEKNPGPIVPVKQTIQRITIGMLSFIASESVFFAGLILAYLYYTVFAPHGTNPIELDVRKTSIFTVCLLGSSVTFWVAEKFLDRGKTGAFHAWLAITVILGGIFLAGQATEYAHLFTTGTMINSSLFATSFFTLTGFHGLHVLLGLAALVVLFRVSYVGEFENLHHAVKAVGLYWHFVDVVWIFVFSIVYLRPLL